MTSWLNPYRWLLYGGLVLALVLGYQSWAAHQQEIGETRSDNRWKTAIDKQKSEAQALLAVETANATAASNALKAFRELQEVKDANAKKTIGNLRDQLATVRLRDPWATGCGGGGDRTESGGAAGAVNSDADRAEAGGLLSEQLADLLRTWTQEADDINAAYSACRLDTRELRLRLQQQLDR